MPAEDGSRASAHRLGVAEVPLALMTPEEGTLLAGRREGSTSDSPPLAAPFASPRRFVENCSTDCLRRAAGASSVEAAFLSAWLAHREVLAEHLPRRSSWPAARSFLAACEPRDDAATCARRARWQTTGVRDRPGVSSGHDRIAARPMRSDLVAGDDASDAELESDGAGAWRCRVRDDALQRGCTKAPAPLARRGRVAGRRKRRFSPAPDASVRRSLPSLPTSPGSPVPLVEATRSLPVVQKASACPG